MSLRISFLTEALPVKCDGDFGTAGNETHYNENRDEGNKIRVLTQPGYMHVANRGQGTISEKKYLET